MSAETSSFTMPRRALVLDSETTGFAHEDGHKIIEIGIVEMIDLKLTGRKFHVYIDPEREVDSGAQAVHGWDRENLIIQSEGKVFTDIYPSLINFLDDPVEGKGMIVAHNAKFDMGHLDAEARRIGAPEFTGNFKVSCSLNLANDLFRGKRNNLDSLAKRLGVDTSARELHGALLDAEILSEVYGHMIVIQRERANKKSEDNVIQFNVQNRPPIEFEPISQETSMALPVVSFSEDFDRHKEMMSRIEDASGEDGLVF